MKATAQDLLVTLFGATTSLLTAVILSWAERHWNFAFYSLMMWFVIPVGAICAGFVAAGGYYLGALLFNHRPQKIILLNMIAVSLGTYLLVHYLDYIYVEVEGRRVSDYLSFIQYWDLVTANTEMTIRAGRGGHIKGPSVALGSWGYIYALLQIIGFALGGVCIYLYLTSKLFCEKCSRYLSNKGTSSRYNGDGDAFKEVLTKILALLQERKLPEVIAMHAAEGGEAKWDAKKHHLRSDVKLHHCKGCGLHHLGFEVQRWNGKDDWKKIDDLSFATVSEGELSLLK